MRAEPYGSNPPIGSDVINPAYGTTRVDTEAPFRIALIELGA